MLPAYIIPPISLAVFGRLLPVHPALCYCFRNPILADGILMRTKSRLSFLQTLPVSFGRLNNNWASTLVPQHFPSVFQKGDFTVDRLQLLEHLAASFFLLLKSCSQTILMQCQCSTITVMIKQTFANNSLNLHSDTGIECDHVLFKCSGRWSSYCKEKYHIKQSTIIFLNKQMCTRQHKFNCNHQVSRVIMTSPSKTIKLSEIFLSVVSGHGLLIQFLLNLLSVLYLSA